MTDKVIFLLSGTSWTVPSDWNSAANTIEMIDGGAPGFNTGSAWQGGKGGDYRKYTNVALTKGATATYAVGGSGGTTSHLNCSSPSASSSGQNGTTDGGNSNLGYGGASGGYGSGINWTSTHNASGGASVATAAAGGPQNVAGNPGVAYGGGGSAIFDTDNGYPGPVAGAQGIIVVTYTPVPPVTGTLASTEAKDTFSATGQVYTPTTGTLSATEAKDTFAASGTVVTPGVSGSWASTETKDTFAASGSVVTGIGGALIATETPDTFAAVGVVVTPPERGTSGAGGMGGHSNPWAYFKEVRAKRAARENVQDLAAPAIIDAAEEARKAAAFEKARVERQARLKEDMRKDAAKEEQRRLVAEAKQARDAEEERKAEARRLTAALDPVHVAKEQRRQRQVHANHDYAKGVHAEALQLIGHVVHHLATTPRKK